MVASIEIASGLSKCRSSGCGYGAKIPKGQKCLRVSIYGAGGNETAFYCEKHMKPVLDSFAKALNDAELDVEDLDK